MSNSLFSFSRAVNFCVEECWVDGCGITFALSISLVNERKADGKAFYCPNGHALSYGEGKVQRLEKQLESNKRTIEWYRADAKRAERKVAAMKGQVTKIKNRVGNGVCPCCNRTFQNLHRHMKHRHPDFKSAE